MKSNNLQKILCAFLAAVLLCGGLAITGYAQPEDDTAPADSTAPLPDSGLYAETDTMELFLEPEYATFAVRSKADGYSWYSHPPAWEDDEYAFGLSRMEMPAWLVLDYTLKSTGISDRVNSYTGSVLEETFTVTKLDNGFRVEFTFPDLSLTVPVEVTLTADGLDVRVLTGSMKAENSDIFVENITVLPYFGAGKAEEDGYLLVPDGSGAIINFDNGKYSAETYASPVYGTEPTEAEEHLYADLSAHKITMPVFGIKNGTHACLAILEDGAELATVKANTGRQITGYANVYAQYGVYGKMLYSLADNETMIYEKANPNLTDLAISYRFLTGAEANYSGMARTYRQYLQAKGALPQSAVSGETCYVTLHGAVTKKVSYLGIVVDSIVPLTTVEEVEATIRRLKELGVADVTVNYVDWNRQALRGNQVTKAAMPRKLGTLKELNALQAAGQTVYATFSNVLQHEKQDFFGRFTNLASVISGSELKLSRYAVGLGRALEGKPYYLLTADRIDKRAAALTKTIDKNGLTHVGLTDMGSLLYNDYRSPTIKRNNTRGILTDALSALGKAADSLLLDNPNQYALAYAADVVNIPVGSSRQSLLDETVPFRQIVLSGAVRYGTDMLNFTDAGEGLLKALETGSMLHYEGFYRDTSVIKGTELAHLCNGSLSLFAETLAQQYTALSTAREAVAGSRLYAHEKLAENVYAAVYENGVRILVNYGETAYTSAGGSEVAAGGYAVERGEN
ncbi:MAG: hypothetical protein IJ518_02900 [Clostridia bacterium]|nr:hypothetical protein [Clostridia bacterium]